MDNWATWFQDVAGGVIGQASAAKFVQPYELEKARFQALGELGMYTEGQPQRVATQNNNGLLLIGVAVVAVLVLMRD